MWERKEESSETRRGVVGVPVVVKPVVVSLPVTLVEVEVPHIQVAIRVAILYKVPSVPPPIEACAISRLNRIWYRNTLALYTKYLHFLLKCLRTPRYPKP